MRVSLTESSLADLLANLREANNRFDAKYRDEPGRRQPVHTVYGGAHLFKADTVSYLGRVATRSLDQFAPDALVFAKAIGLTTSDHLPSRPPVLGAPTSKLQAATESAPENRSSSPLAKTVYDRVCQKLRQEPVEDFRIDFEDGYGSRPDDEEDGHALAAANEVATGLHNRTLPPFIGIRIKPLTEESRERSIRTLDIFISTLLEKSTSGLPENFVITLPKITHTAQVTTLVGLLESLEQATGLAKFAGQRLQFEMMVETPQAIVSDRGELNLPLLLDAAKGRCVAAHFGAYDYTASCDVTAAYQDLSHPACDFARQMMKISFAGRGIWLSDGATNVLPVAPHRFVEGGQVLTAQQVEENRATVHNAWKTHYEHVRQSLKNGFYQGWDLHPAQLPTRYAAVYAFFLESLDAASDRLRNFVERAAKATLSGDVFDDAATGQGLLNYFLRAVNCGALTEEEAIERSGLTIPELRSGSFLRILQNRKSL